jgi:hypothetical protein
MIIQPTPDDRATEFKAVDASQQQYKGETLLVVAYAGIWLFLMVWLLQMWRTQRGIRKRIDGIEAAIDRAAAGKDKKAPSA